MRPIERFFGAKALSVNWTTPRPERISPMRMLDLRDKLEALASDPAAVDDFEGLVTKAYRGNGVVFACVLARMLPFSEVRFQYLDLKTKDLFGDPTLSLLERPWPNGTTGELLARMIQDADLAGNFFAARHTLANGKESIRRLRPDWVRIISGVRGEASIVEQLDLEPLGYLYSPPGGKPEVLNLEDTVHFSPIPDPMHPWRGMSWLTPVLREVEGDNEAARYKTRFFRNGTLATMAVVYDKDVEGEQFEHAVQLFEETYAGAKNAYKALHIGGGADVKTLSADPKALDFSRLSATAETRIASAAGVGAIIARLSEGMQGSALNAGNYGAAKRQFADMTIRPLWRIAAASLEKFTQPRTGAQLWFDTSRIAFLKEDEKDAAEILQQNATSIKQLVDAGFSPDAAITAITNGDLRLLKGQHSGLYSVQLQAPGANNPAPAA